MASRKFLSIISLEEKIADGGKSLASVPWRSVIAVPNRAACSCMHALNVNCSYTVFVQ